MDLSEIEFEKGSKLKKIGISSFTIINRVILNDDNGFIKREWLYVVKLKNKKGPSNILKLSMSHYIEITDDNDDPYLLSLQTWKYVTMMIKIAYRITIIFY